MLNKKSALITILFTACVMLSAEVVPGSLKKFASKAGKKDVILVGKVECSGIDTASRLDAFSAFPDERHEGELDYKKAAAYTDAHPEIVYMVNGAHDYYHGSTPKPGEYFFLRATPSKKHLYPGNFRFWIFPEISTQYYWDVFTDVSIVVPQDAKFVYAGTFSFEFNQDLTVKKMKISDEYEEAKKVLAVAYGEEVELYRGEFD